MPDRPGPREDMSGAAGPSSSRDLLRFSERLNAFAELDGVASAIVESAPDLNGCAAAVLYLAGVADLKPVACAPAPLRESLDRAPVPGPVVRALESRSEIAGPSSGALASIGGHLRAVPLPSGDPPIAVLLLVYAEEPAPAGRPNGGSPDWRALASSALRRAADHRQARKARERLRRLHDIGYVVASSMADRDEILRLVARKAREILDADAALVGLVRGDELEYVIEDRRAGEPPNVLGQRVSLHDSLGGWVVQNRSPLLCEDLLNDPRLPSHIRPLLDVESALLAPLRTHDRVIGVLAVEHRRRQRYPEDYAHVLEILANQVAAALESADLFERTRRSEEQYRQLLQVAPVPIVRVDLDGRITHSNEAAARMGGVPVERLIGRSFLDFLPPEEREAAMARRARVLAGEVVRFDTTVVLPGGERRMFAMVSSPLREEGRIIGSLAIMRDVTEERESQARLMQTEKLAAMGDLVSGVAHELNNPLAGIVNLAELIGMAADEGEIRESADAIKREAQRAARVVKNLQLFAEPRPSRPMPVDVGELLDEAVEIWRAGGGGVEVAVLKRFTATGPVLADPAQLRHALLAVIRNAEDAIRSASSGGTLTLSTQESDGGVRITVSDTGPGVPRELRERIFDPFFTTRSSGTAAGLGLSIAYRIVSSLEGTIRYEEGPGGGATFVIELSVTAASTQADEESTGSPDPQDPGIRVLIVEDEPAVRSSVSRLLARLGYTTVVAGDGRAALDLLSKERFDVVLTDVKMPEMSGEELFAHIRARHPELVDRVVFTTGDTVNPGTAEFLRECGRPSVVKPFDIRELDRLLRSIARPLNGSG